MSIDYQKVLLSATDKTITEYSILDGVTSIEYRAFNSCSSLTSVTIPEGVTKIGNYAFRSCRGLTSITIPSSVTSIGGLAFSDCSALPTDANGIQYESEDKIVLIKAPRSLTGKFVISDSVRFIHDSAFRFCSSLTSVTIPSSVTSIGDYVFDNCTGLTSITIPSSVTSIGSTAFGMCSGLTSITIPSSVTSIGESVFNGCESLPKDANGVQYESSAKKVLIEVPNSATGKFVISDTVRFIHSYAFSYCSGLTSVTIPSSVTAIGNAAFSSCSGLTSITIPSSVTEIGWYAFSGCSGLTNVILENRTLSEAQTLIGTTNPLGYTGTITYNNGTFKTDFVDPYGD